MDLKNEEHTDSTAVPCPCTASIETGPRPEPPGRGPRKDYTTVCPDAQDGQHVWSLDFRCSNASVFHYRCACGAMGYRDRQRDKGHAGVRQFAPNSKRMRHAKKWAERQELKPPTITALPVCGSSASGGFKPGGCQGSKWRG